MALSLALYQPEIAGNTGALLRLGACLSLDVEIIEPAGFLITDRTLRRAGMDYLEMARMVRHDDFAAFDAARRQAGRRLVLLTTKGARDYRDVHYRADDVLLLGRESAGVPAHVHDLADERLVIPMAPGARSLNLAVTAAMVAGEALRQLRSGSLADCNCSGYAHILA